MRQFDTLRKRYDLRGRWFQVGLASATLLTPLLKRWNDLRAAEQARAWRDEAEARLREARSWNPLRISEARREAQEAIEQEAVARGNVSATIWLVGVGIGLVAAGTGAFLLVRHRLRQQHEEPMLDLPLPLNGNGAHLHETAQALAEEIRWRDEQAANLAARNGTASAPTNTPMPIPPPAQAGPLIPPSATDMTRAATPQASDLGESGDIFGGAPTLGDSTASVGAADMAGAAFIGNIHTMVYHPADADDLPAEESRVYFDSEEQAHDAGYRRARDEVSSGGE
jgi:hypothetical protein